MEFHIELIGYLGTAINAFSTIPQIFKVCRTHEVSSFSFMFLFAWVLGCALLLVYTLFTEWNYPTLINYFLNTLFPSILTYYYLKYRIK